MSSSFAYGTAASGNSQGVIDRLTKTVNELNDQVAELRDENSASRVPSAPLLSSRLTRLFARSDSPPQARRSGRVGLAACQSLNSKLPFVPLFSALSRLPRFLLSSCEM